MDKLTRRGKTPESLAPSLRQAAVAVALAGLLLLICDSWILESVVIQAHRIAAIQAEYC